MSVIAPLGPGLHLDIPAARYHEDPCATPSLSSSIAETIVVRTPRHAWFAHPRLNPDFETDEGNAAMALGSVAHELILGRGGGIEIVDADDWRTKAAKEARQAATDAGRTAVLSGTMADAERIRDAAVAELRARPDCANFFDNGARSEVVGIWHDIGGALCRMMIDRLTPAGTIYDLKVSGRGLDDRALANSMEDGYGLRAAFYLRGAAALHPEMAGRLRYRWIFVESKPPHAVRVVTADARTLALGDRTAALGIEKWRRCLATGDWPSYPRQVETVGVADWTEKRVMDREAIDPDAARMMVSGRPDPVSIYEPDPIPYGEYPRRLENHDAT